MPLDGTYRLRVDGRRYEIVRGSRGASGRESSGARVLARALRRGDRRVLAAVEAVLGRDGSSRRRASRGHRGADATRVDALVRDFLIAVDSGLVEVRSADAAGGTRSRTTTAGGAAPEPGPPESPEPETTWFELRVVDEVGQPVAGMPLSFDVAGATSAPSTGGDGTARVHGPRGSEARVVLDRSAAFSLLEARWQSPRSGEPPSGRGVTTVELGAGSATVSLSAESPVTVALIPPLTKIGVEELAFVGNHGLMKAHTADWEDAGPAHSAPEWTRGGTETRPVSYTKNTALDARATFSATPPRGPVEGIAVTATPSFGGLTLRGAGRVRGPATPVDLSGGLLPDEVVALRGSISYQAEVERTGREHRAGSSSGHTVYVTLGAPHDLTGTREHGITEKRMDAAVRLVAGARSNDPHTIVAHLMRKFRFYTLRPNPAVPAAYEHPTYFNHGPGAWPMADHIDKSGECQAIVRFVRAVIAQVGCPGTADLVVVWADPDVQGGQKALEAAVPPGGGLHGKKKVVGGKTWYACLVDTHPVEGRIYDVEELNSDYMGLNNFEACLRFEHGGVTRYYGGGAGVYDSPDQVILAFYALAWISFAPHPNGHRGAKVEKVVKRWRDASGNVL